MRTSDRIDLSRIQFLLVDSNPHSMSLTATVITGFGARELIKAASVAEAVKIISENDIDFLVLAGRLPDGDAFEFVRWVRRKAPEINRFIPVVVLSGHIRPSDVFIARDSGVHATISKPLIPKVLLERTFWMARDTRQFVECDTFLGPDRRFRSLGPPEGQPGRRRGDDPAIVEELA